MGLIKTLPVDVVVFVFGYVLVLLQEEFDMIFSHDCVLDLRCVLGSDPFAINDEHGLAHCVHGDELVVIGLCCWSVCFCMPCTCHYSFGLQVEGFLCGYCHPGGP